MSIDKRLDAIAILHEVHDPRGKFNERVKDAFIDDGWVQVKYAPGSRYEFPMTGPEWYARFDEEMRGDLFPYRRGDTTVRDTIVTIRKAARRAAGVDE